MMTQIPLLKNAFNGCIKSLSVTDLTLSYDRAKLEVVKYTLEVVKYTLAQLEQVND